MISDTRVTGGNRNASDITTSIAANFVLNTKMQ